jgi:hypothetical protein
MKTRIAGRLCLVIDFLLETNDLTLSVNLAKDMFNVMDLTIHLCSL